MSLKKIYSFKITEETLSKMQEFGNINWSAWIRTQITKKLEELEKLERVSDKNFCIYCGKQLFSEEDKFCRECGAKLF
jgi:hypothetical protein